MWRPQRRFSTTDDHDDHHGFGLPAGYTHSYLISPNNMCRLVCLLEQQGGPCVSPGFAPTRGGSMPPLVFLDKQRLMMISSPDRLSSLDDLILERSTMRLARWCTRVCLLPRHVASVQNCAHAPCLCTCVSKSASSSTTGWGGVSPPSYRLQLMMNRGRYPSTHTSSSSSISSSAP